MTDRTDRPHDHADDAHGESRKQPVSAGAGGGVGGAAGAAAGAVAGTLTLGPIGTIVGAITGAIGGGFAGLAAAEMPAPDDSDEAYFREHHRESGAHLADVSYDRAAPAYHLGHVAARNPDYRGRTFDEIEPDLRRGWSDDVSARHGDWTRSRDFVRAGYERGVRAAGAQPDVTPAGTTPSHDRAGMSDPLAADAPVAGNPNATRPIAGAPEHSGGSAPGWLGAPSDQGGFGTHRAPGSVRDSETGEDVR